MVAMQWFSWTPVTEQWISKRSRVLKRGNIVMKRAAAWTLLQAVALCAAEIELQNGRFVVRDWPQGARFAIYVGDSATPMLGSSSTAGGVLTWTPKYALSEGLTYRAVLESTPPVVR